MNSEISYFTTSLQHILAELERIDLLIWLQFWKARQLPSADHPFQGFYLSEQEVNTLLARPTGMPWWATMATPLDFPEAATTLKQLVIQLGEQKAASLQQGISLRLESLSQLYNLSSLETDILLICLAPELDLRYEKIFAYLQDDLTKKRPSVDLVLNLICASFEEKIAARQWFEPQSPLLKYHLLTLFEDPSHQCPPLLSKYLKVDEQITNYLLDLNTPDARLIPCIKSIKLEEERKSLFAADIPKQCLDLWTNQMVNGRSAPIFYFQGENGVGKQATAATVCRELTLPLRVVDVTRLVNSPDLSFETAVRLVLRNALLDRAALYWANFDLLLNEEAQFWCASFFEELAAHHGLVFLGGVRVWEASAALCERPFLRIEFPHPNYHKRTSWWHTHLDDVLHPQDRPILDEIADKFSFTLQQIEDAVFTARNLALRRHPSVGKITPSDLYAACRLHSNQQLTILAHKLTPHYQWSDITLPPDQLQQLRELCASVKHRGLVYHQWGFERKLTLGKGVTALFAGPSGTGKTMAAEIIANELALDLYKIDLSTVISKYIGETEKNLSRIFAEAHTSNAILFFDEADALFGKRSEVKDSHDRYANVEISYLLQKMDEYEGITLLATNLRKNMDEAFVRRIAFTVYFPLPDERDRLRIWQGVWPAELPRSRDLDLPFMARQFKLSGGNIKNIALNAAFLAAEDGQVVDTSHLILATKREFQKSGKVCVKTEFGPYYPLVEDHP